jgi:FKBP-type peptidyl-prolyl cis-trans isomerases 1
MLKNSRPFFALALILGPALLLTACGSDGSTAGKVKTSAYGPSKPADSTTTTFVQTAAQQPCVAVVDPLPAGAPAVPVKVGPAPTTLITEDLTPGTGTEVLATSSVTVDYIGVACSTGKIFDSSYAAGQPVTFPLNGVIPGWSQGLVGLKVGGKRLLGIPSGLGYGASGQGADIGPNEALWFVVDLKSVS